MAQIRFLRAAFPGHHWRLPPVTAAREAPGVAVVAGRDRQPALWRASVAK